MQKRGKKIELKKVEFLEKMRSITYSGNVTMVCQALGIGRTQVYQWRNDDPKFEQEWGWAIRESVETQVDETEQTLRKAVLDGNITAIIFKLKSLKPQVYGDKVEFKGSIDQGPPLKAGFVQALERLLDNIKADELSRLSHQ